MLIRSQSAVGRLFAFKGFASLLLALVSLPAIHRADAAEPSGPAQLSVAPSDHIVYPDDRPSWVEADNDLEAATHRWIIRTIPCETREECEDRLALALRVGVEQYATELLGSSDVEGLFPIDDEQTMRRVIARRYDGSLTQGNLPAYESALELRLEPSIQSRLRHAWQNREVGRRLGAVGVLVTGGWLCLAALAAVTASWSRHRTASRSNHAVE